MKLLILTIFLGSFYLALITYWLYLKSEFETRIRAEESDVWLKMGKPSLLWRHYTFMNFTDTVLFNQIKNPEILALGIKAGHYRKLSVYYAVPLFLMLLFLVGSNG